MKQKKYIILAIIGFVYTAAVFSQTVNIGELTVSQNTILSIVKDFNNTTTGILENNGDTYIYSNWNNDNTVNFNPVITRTANGLTRFVGTNTQSISGSQFNFFNNILFDNSAIQPAFELSGMISVATESDFMNGIVDNDNFGGQFVFEDGATHISTSDESHVDGYVVKAGDDEFIYPIGDGSYFRFAGISEPQNANDIFTAKYFFEETNLNYPIDPISNLSGDLVLIDNAEYWTIEQTSSTTNILLTLSWSDLTTPNDILVEPFENIHIARWDENNQIWVDEGGVVDLVAQTVTTNVSGYGVFTLARVSSTGVLPGCMTIYNIFSPNDDSANQFLTISCIENYPNSTLEIFNRWGNTVYTATGYKNDWNGVSNGRATISAGDKLPAGTYFYVLDLKNGSSPVVKGWIQIAY